MKTVSKILLIFAAALPAFATGPAWDSSGNKLLNGTYYFRQVIYQSSSGSLSAAYSYYGNISFNGAGAYTVTNGTLVESSGQIGSLTPAGTYSVSASGYGFMSSPVLSGANIIFLVSNGILIGSETENGAVSGGSINDLFVAAPSSATLSLSSLSGTYTIASMFPNADATYQLSPNGTASLPNFTISGYFTAGAAATQNASGIKIAYSSGAYSISFPNNTSANFYQGGTAANGGTGSLFLYSSPDSNFVFGGTQYGFDMFVGVRNASSGANTPLTTGLYYEAGIDNSSNGLDTYYGSFNAFQGNIIGHERLLSAGYAPQGLTYYNDYPTNISGTYTDSSQTVNYTMAQNGIRIGYGTAGYPAIAVALPYTPPTTTQSVYLDPTGVVNSGSSAPYTAGISPGEFITLYNVTLPGINSLNVSTTLPTLTTSLAGIKVSVDGIAAPLYYVTTGSLSFVVPYEVSAFPVASIQINDNGVLSNIVTTYVNQTTPGVFTFPAGGIGVAAMTDQPASGPAFVVGTNNPAKPGDIVALFLTGLGAPFPSNPNGAPGGTSCASGECLVNNIGVDVSGVTIPAANITFAGPAPLEVSGLYQFNFQIPALCTASGQTGCIESGNNSIGILGPDSYSNESIFPVSSGGTTAAVGTSQTASVVRKTLPRLSKTRNR